MRKSLLELLACPVIPISNSAARQCRRIVSEAGHWDAANSIVTPPESSCQCSHGEQDYMEVFSNLRRNPDAQLTKSGELDVEKITREEFAAQTRTRARELRDKTVLDVE